jgi:hypothetical protein
MKGIYLNTFIQKLVYSDNEVDMKVFWTKMYLLLLRTQFSISVRLGMLFKFKYFKDAGTNYGP